MPELTLKSFQQAKDLICKFQNDACLLPIEISTILNTGAAIAVQRLQQLAQSTILPSKPRATVRKRKKK